jgi:phosphoglycerol transferase MdoB-like AlkP superfamily enzyme
MQFILPILFFAFFSLIVFTLARTIMLLRYGDLKSVAGLQKDLFKAYILGMRFDLKNIASISFLPLVLAIIGYFVPSTNASVYWVMLIYYFMVMFVFLVLIITDYFFYSYFSDRINYLIWGLIDDDLKALLITIWKDYNVLAYVAGIIALLVVVFLCIKLILASVFLTVFSSFTEFVVIWIALLILSIGFTRGTLRHQPLSVKHAYISENAFINLLSHNSVTLMYYMIKLRKRSKRNKAFATPFHRKFDKIKAILHPDSQAENINELLLKYSPNQASRKNKPHVVVFMMESFGSQFLIQDDNAHKLLGNLEQHFKEDLVFYNFLPEANGTAESFGALATNTVPLPFSNALTESRYLNQTAISSIAKLYQDNGYETLGVYGGQLSWRNIGTFLYSQGFEKVIGEMNIIKALNLDTNITIGNEWGVFDGYLTQYVLQHLKSATKPQFMMILSTTNHPPFSTPKHFSFEHQSLVKQYEHIFLRKEEALKRFSTYTYCNNVLGDFMTEIKSDPGLADNTLIAITGDHAYRGYKTSEQEMFLKSAVPFYLYASDAYIGSYNGIDDQKWGSHKDIMPTLIELSLPGVGYYGLGHNMLSNEYKGIAFNASGMAINEHGLVLLGALPTFYQFDGNNTYATEANEDLKNLLNHYYASIDATSMLLYA